MDLSWFDCIYVGDAFFGGSKNSFLVEKFLESPPPDWLELGVGAGGDIVLLLS